MYYLVFFHNERSVSLNLPRKCRYPSWDKGWVVYCDFSTWNPNDFCILWLMIERNIFLLYVWILSTSQNFEFEFNRIWFFRERKKISTESNVRDYRAANVQLSSQMLCYRCVCAAQWQKMTFRMWQQIKTVANIISEKMNTTKLSLRIVSNSMQLNLQHKMMKINHKNALISDRNRIEK